MATSGVPKADPWWPALKSPFKDPQSSKDYRSTCIVMLHISEATRSTQDFLTALSTTRAALSLLVPPGVIVSQFSFAQGMMIEDPDVFVLVYAFRNRSGYIELDHSALLAPILRFSKEEPQVYDIGFADRPGTTFRDNEAVEMVLWKIPLSLNEAQEEVFSDGFQEIHEFLTLFMDRQSNDRGDIRACFRGWVRSSASEPQDQNMFCNLIAWSGKDDEERLKDPTQRSYNQRRRSIRAPDDVHATRWLEPVQRMREVGLVEDSFHIMLRSWLL